jgi:hypothetical protein
MSRTGVNMLSHCLATMVLGRNEAADIPGKAPV